MGALTAIIYHENRIRIVFLASYCALKSLESRTDEQPGVFDFSIAYTRKRFSFDFYRSLFLITARAYIKKRWCKTLIWFSRTPQPGDMEQRESKTTIYTNLGRRGDRGRALVCCMNWRRPRPRPFVGVKKTPNPITLYSGAVIVGENRYSHAWKSAGAQSCETNWELFEIVRIKIFKSKIMRKKESIRRNFNCGRR